MTLNKKWHFEECICEGHDLRRTRSSGDKFSGWDANGESIQRRMESVWIEQRDLFLSNSGSGQRWIR